MRSAAPEKIPRAVWRRKMIACFVCRKGKRERGREREGERKRNRKIRRESACVETPVPEIERVLHNFLLHRDHA